MSVCLDYGNTYTEKKHGLYMQFDRELWRSKGLADHLNAIMLGEIWLFMAGEICKYISYTDTQRHAHTYIHTYIHFCCC